MNSIFDEVRAALFSVWHRRWLALGVAWAICMVGWLVVALIPNNYESRARIFVQFDDVLADVTGVPSNTKRDIDRVRQTLTSAINLEKVVRGTSLGADVASPKAMENTVLDLAKTVRVESQQESLFEITARYGNGSHSDAENAKLAQDIVQKMIDIFREENLSGNRGEMTQSLDFMNQQLAMRQKELEAAEQRRLVFEAQNPDVAAGGMSALQKLEQNRAELRGIDADLAAAQSALAAISGQLAGTPRTLAGSAGMGGARGALAQAQSDLTAMRSRGLTDNHPDVIAARNQVASLRQQVAAEGGSPGVPNPAYSSLESIRADRQATVQGLNARRAAVQSELSRVTSQQITNPQVAAEQQRINRDYDVLKQQYDKLLQDREELRLRGSVQTEHSAIRFQVIDPPTTPRQPVWPNRPLLLLAVLLAGTGGGIAAAFAVGQLRSTFATTAGLERAFDLPVLGAITNTLTDAGREQRRKRAQLFFAATAALGGLFVLLLTAEFIQRGGVA
ncbi:polysaccharide chain length determinant protein (PEP-CTERM system associated) [Novosphingobium kunmingense]|uniref:Polysaccharide chain length determinant protein (PEP-CTERM system associated) n=1 Tax=Novosphingobium kunmingense TaxID=1211806 RepID=A0A2N0I334_9SPHN|nr:XrtA system polysaccharide chain length determinant [Novosphingobium kunmingense]PKB25598.1 polysaccharide chain length determinant protein (PEP-CTERM system associated) [Novosphingobium kunmingense]